MVIGFLKIKAKSAPCTLIWMITEKQVNFTTLCVYVDIILCIF